MILPPFRFKYEYDEGYVHEYFLNFLDIRIILRENEEHEENIVQINTIHDDSTDSFLLCIVDKDDIYRFEQWIENCNDIILRSA